MTSTASEQSKKQANTGTIVDKSTNGAKKPKKSNGNASNHRPRAKKKEGRQTFPFAVEKFSLNHPVMQGAFNRYFDRFRATFYHVTSVLQKLGLDDGLTLVDDYLSSQMDDAESAIVSAKGKVLTVLEARTGSTQYRIHSPNTSVVEAKIPSFMVRRYMNLFKQVDDYIDLVVFAEGMGAVSFLERQKTLQNSPRYVTKIAGRFQSIGTKLSLEELRRNGNGWEVLSEIINVAKNLKPIGEGRPLALQKPKPKSQTGQEKAEKTENMTTSRTGTKGAEQEKQTPTKKKVAKKKTAKKTTTKKAVTIESKSVSEERPMTEEEKWGLI